MDEYKRLLREESTWANRRSAQIRCLAESLIVISLMATMLIVAMM